MNPFALLLALLGAAGAAGVMGRSNDDNATENGMADDGTADGSDGPLGAGGAGATPGTPPAGEEIDAVVTIPTPPVQTGGTGEDGGSVAPTPITGNTISVVTGRVTTLDPPDGDIASIRIVSQPQNGHVSVNPDNTIALVMTDTQATGSMSFSYEITRPDGTTSLQSTPLQVTPAVHTGGWGTGESHYMLETDANGDLVIEHGDTHRAVYVSASDKALSLADIARLEGLTVDKITGAWLAANPEYGASENMALAEDAGSTLWQTISGRGSETSNWLLLERGHTYDSIGQLVIDESWGESEIHPLYIGAWGDGTKPEVTENQNYVGERGNVVIDGLHFSGGVRMVSDSENILFNDVTFTKESLIVQGGSGITVRDSAFYDIYHEEPVGGAWNPGDNKIQGAYISTTNGLLLEGNFFDHNGWADDYREDGSTAGGQPPSKFSHNMYLQYNNADVTLRDTISMRAASFGVQVRSGGFIEDNVFLDNNIGLNFLGGLYANNGPSGNYSLVTDNLVTSAGFRDAPNIGALAWGMYDGAYMSSLVDNIVAHLADPNNPAELSEKSGAGGQGLILGETAPYYDDTIVWNWRSGSQTTWTDRNVEGLDTSVLDQTTIQRFTAQLLGKPDATITDLADYLRGEADGAFKDVVDADLIIRFFQSGFGIDADVRGEAGMIRFVPNDLGDGVRWDNRLNWTSGDLPGSVRGDSVDLGGNKVMYGGTATINQLEYGANGGLQLEHGKLTVRGGMETGAEGATLDVNGAGQILTEGGGGTGTLDIDVTGGRFANTGAFRMNSDLTASGGQTLLGVDGATYAVTDGSRLEVVGDDGRVGFDGQSGGISILGLADQGTLAFTAKDGALGTIEEFRSGALGDVPNVKSGVDLGSARLQIDLTELAGATGNFMLVDVDELIGSFGSGNITGLGNRNAELVVDYQTDSVMLKLSAGTGAIKATTVGTADMVTGGEQDLMAALTAGRGTYDDEVPAQDDDDYLYAA